MTADISGKIELVAETSWEVCNKIGGIHTVLSTKAAELKKLLGDKLVFIGPDFEDSEKKNMCFTERKTLLKRFSSSAMPCGIKIRCGRWNIPGSPIVILVNFRSVYPLLNELYGEMWKEFGVDSLHSYGDYDESCAFSVAAALVISQLINHLGVDPSKTIAHFDEWTTGMGLLLLKLRCPDAATVFTTHATTVGRSICGNGKALYKYFTDYIGDVMAEELNVQSKHSLEKAAALNADCFTTVSSVTARECKQLLGREPDVVTPNGFEPSFVPGDEKWSQLRKSGRKKILQIASILADRKLSENSLIVATSGRNEFRNKGIDLFLDALYSAGDRIGPGKQILALILVPSWVKQPSGDLIIDLDFDGFIRPEPDFITHRLHNEDSDAIFNKIRQLKELRMHEGKHDNVRFMFVPSYLDGNDGIIDISYYNLLPAIDLTVFGSYYEPWGYTPLESVAFGIPTVTTDKAGFGRWIAENGLDSLKEGGVEVISREDDNYRESADEIARIIGEYMNYTPDQKAAVRTSALSTAEKAEWKYFISKYEEAFETAFRNHKSKKVPKK